jgi:hypothetical protein
VILFDNSLTDGQSDARAGIFDGIADDRVVRGIYNRAEQAVVPISPFW